MPDDRPLQPTSPPIPPRRQLPSEFVPQFDDERSESVDHPAHYGGADSPYEAIKVIEAWELGFCLGNAIKYIARAGRKDTTADGMVEDLLKAQWYLSRRIEQLTRVDS